MLEGVLNGDIDIAAGVFPEMPNELRSTALFEEHYACLVDRHSLPDGAILDLPTYLARPHVLLEMRGSGTPEIERALTALWHKRRGGDQALNWLNGQIERASGDIDWRPFTRTTHKDSP
ncbi:hypothetical protein D3C79_902510 [compost metagenome]